MAGVPRVILVAAATANTGSSVVRALAACGGVAVRAMVRKLDDERVQELATLPGVTLVQGDFDDAASVAVALRGVDRALLVSAAFAYEQFEREASFIVEAASAGISVVRIATATALTMPGTRSHYGRTHHGIEAFAVARGYPVVNIRPDFYLTNAFFAAEEISGFGQITYPSKGDRAGAGKQTHMVDPRDVASAAATILMLPTDQFAVFLAARNIEVHGPAAVSFEEQARRFGADALERTRSWQASNSSRAVVRSILPYCPTHTSTLGCLVA